VTPQPLGSRYLLDDPIGQGGMGVVWRGRDRQFGDLCAIKLLRPEFAADPESVARFVRERTALVRFRHPNVVTLRDMIVEGDRLALVMDLVEGGDLDSYRRNGGGTLSLGESLGLTAQICDALAAAHAAGIVHRDLKPANVLLDAGQVRLADFGIARIAGDSAATRTGAIIGTIGFMAPEVIRGEPPTAACDVYALGITLYELLTGARPFTGEVVAIMHGHLEVAPPRPDGMPGRLWALISACLSKDPGARPAAAVLARALRDPALRGEPMSPREPAWPGHAPHAGSVTGADAWTPAEWATSARFGSASEPRPAPELGLPAAAPMPQAGTTDGAAAPPPTDRRTGRSTDRSTGLPTGHRASGGPSHRAVKAAAAAAALVLAGGVGAYLATSGSSAGNAGPASPLAATMSGGAAAPTGTVTKSTPAKSSPVASAATPATTRSTPATTGSTPAATASTPAASASTSAAPAGTPGPVGPNLLTDGAFTESNLDAWEPVSNSFLVTGEDGEANAVQMSGPTAGVNQVVSGLKPGKAYELSGFIISDTGNDTTMIGVKNFDSTDGISRRVNSTTWSAVTMTFTPVAGHTSADIFCWQVVAGNGYCTNLSLRALG
jgi:serine/threonine-protein kinase